MTVSTNTSFENDLLDCVKLFTDKNIKVEHVLEINANSIKCLVFINDIQYEYSFSHDFDDDEIANKRMKKRFSKLSLYYALSEFFKRKMPWGALTGIRPSKLFYELGDEREQTMRELFKVSEPKIQLLKDVYECQKTILNHNQNVVDIYVSIPFCTTRCSYCSFISCQISECRHLIDDYIKCLIIEIAALKDIIKDKGYKVNCIYVGGGTPTSISCSQLDSILKHLDFPCSEFTVEAGRADTITREHLDIIAKYNADRISVNPQTFHDKTLIKVGRHHTVDQFKSAYKLAREYDFKINLDLICGLPGESYEDFVYTLEQAIKLCPDNITVHTLALKRGSVMKTQDTVFDENMISNMVNYSFETLRKNSYIPYYLYRQKYVAQSLENVGYQKNNTACRYNIDIMEENTNILAVGANAISKRVFLSEHRIERVANAKDIRTYIDSIEKNISRKQNLFL